MVIEKEWHTIKELSEIWHCSVDDILHLGVSGQLTLGFDWITLRCDTPDYSFFLGDDDDVIYYDECSKNFDASSSNLAPNYEDNPLLRLAYLSVNQIGLIIKNGEDTIIGADIANDVYFLAQPIEGAKNTKKPIVKIEDIVIKSADIGHKRKQCRQSKNIEQPPQHITNSSKENTNLYRTIGLFATAVVDLGGKNLRINGKINVDAVAKKLEQYIPQDPFGNIESQGLKNRSLRDRIAKGLDLLHSE